MKEHVVIVVHEGITYLVTLSFFEQAVQDESFVSASVKSVVPATIMGQPIRGKK